MQFANVILRSLYSYNFRSINREVNIYINYKTYPRSWFGISSMRIAE